MSYVPTRWQQQATGYFCGPAAARIVLSAFDVPLPSQEKLAELCDTSAEDGTSRYGVQRGLHQVLGNPLYTVRSTGDDLLADAAKALAIGRPLPVNIVVRPGGPRPPGWAPRTGITDHWVALVGISASRLLICDPASGREGFNPRPVYAIPAPTFLELVEKTYLALASLL
ncbi:Peptidase_C39 like family protein [Amycolatopsis xylanica]|uniref:Peptidase_C39 like family protein n=1 Tax=Amycolatopsis xylanica TaxID=589385 RepID=A0A1H3S807_9PSEU|nr:C39 family peptidase [Amycolatopsis xylanica]SDZ34223.1 Peptidase_C39 like family protein [Amycolatopsis xylanica]